MVNMNRSQIIAMVTATVLVLGTMIVLAAKSRRQRLLEPQIVEEVDEDFRPAPTLPPQTINISLRAKGDGSYFLTMAGIPNGVKKMSYEITYDTLNKGRQGVLSSPIEIEPSQLEYTNEQLIFGSCSKKVCVYDEGINNAVITIRFIYENDEIRIYQEELEI